jgi:hypothetical protein
MYVCIYDCMYMYVPVYVSCMQVYDALQGCRAAAEATMREAGERTWKREVKNDIFRTPLPTNYSENVAYSTNISAHNGSADTDHTGNGIFFSEDEEDESSEYPGQQIDGTYRWYEQQERRQRRRELRKQGRAPDDEDMDPWDTQDWRGDWAEGGVDVGGDWAGGGGGVLPDTFNYTRFDDEAEPHVYGGERGQEGEFRGQGVDQEGAEMGVGGVGGWGGSSPAGGEREFIGNETWGMPGLMSDDDDSLEPLPSDFSL